jgi:histidinol dehydrogenase
MKVYRYSELAKEEVDSLLLRPKIDFSGVLTRVSPIIDDVRARGDVALAELTAKFDRVELDPAAMCVDCDALPEPELAADVKAAFDVAYANITKFHQAQVRQPIELETMPGVHCKRVCRPIERVGIYVPGGTAVLPSTAMMLGVPSQIAGCTTVVLASPPRADGSICPEVLYAAKKCGVHKILKVGGAQAVAAMAFGTATCPKVDKIVGPGNQYVTAAKMLVQNSGDAMVAIDMPAGPSEQLCIADKSATLKFTVSDVLSQAEHGVDSQVVAVLLEDGFDLPGFQAEIQAQLDALPRRDIAREAVSKSFVLLVSSREEALAFTNAYAPEHLVIQTDDADEYAEGVINAGSIFLGHYTPESVGDYASGTNHSLPTYGYARMYGGVSLDTFVKYITMQRLTQEGLKNVGPTVEVMARGELLWKGAPCRLFTRPS